MAGPPQPIKTGAPVPVPTPQAPEVPRMKVRATANGTYPNIGQTRAVWRDAGDVFELNNPKDFSSRWMQEIKPGESVEPLPEADPNIPQTTAPMKPIKGDFQGPPIHL